MKQKNIRAVAVRYAADIGARAETNSTITDVFLGGPAPMLFNDIMCPYTGRDKAKSRKTFIGRDWLCSSSITGRTWGLVTVWPLHKDLRSPSSCCLVPFWP